MKAKGYYIATAILTLVVCFSYFYNFYIILDYEISSDAAAWGQLGSYIGGVLSPLLSFVTIVLLIKSLLLQSEANDSLITELKSNEKIEKLRSFETLFFNLINSQKNLFESFKLDFSESDKVIHLSGAEAVQKVEDYIESIKSEEKDEVISEYLQELDKTDKIYGLLRAFYVIVKMTFNKLSDKEGFSEKDRREYFISLINFTDYAQLRLVLICIQFMDYEPAKYLKESTEFKEVIEELKMSYELY